MIPGSQVREFRGKTGILCFIFSAWNPKGMKKNYGWAYQNTALHAEHHLNHIKFKFDTFLNSSTDVPGQCLPSH